MLGRGRERDGMGRTLLEEGGNGGGPLLSQEVGSSERSVSSADDEAVDTLLNQVESSELSSLGRSDWRAGAGEAEGA